MKCCRLETVNRPPYQPQSFPCEIRGSSQQASQVPTGGDVHFGPSACESVSTCSCMSETTWNGEDQPVSETTGLLPGALTTVPCALPVRLLRCTSERLSAWRCDSAHHRETCLRSEQSKSLALPGACHQRVRSEARGHDRRRRCSQALTCERVESKGKNTQTCHGCDD